MRKKGISKKVTHKYLQVLKSFKQECEEASPRRLLDYAKKHKVSSIFFLVLKKEGIIKKVDGSYKWTSIDPNVHMARKLQETLLSYQNSQKEKRGSKYKTEPSMSGREVAKEMKKTDKSIAAAGNPAIKSHYKEKDADPPIATAEKSREMNAIIDKESRSYEDMAKELGRVNISLTIEDEPEVKREVITESAKTVLWGLFSSASIKRETEYK